jgi:tetratricopeptide (TPR) repeat protein
MALLHRAGIRSIAASGLTLFALGFLVPSHVLAEDPLFDIMDADLEIKDRSPDRAICERAVYGKNFDRWIKDYSEGRVAEAYNDWGGVLRETRGATKLYELASLTCGRLDFLDAKQSVFMEKTGGITGALKVLLSDTERQLGPCNQTASLADYLSDRYKKSKLYKEAIVYSQKALDLRLKSLPELDRNVYESLINLGELQCLNHDWAAAKKNGDRALAIANKVHSGAAKYKARTLLVRISRNSGTASH